MADRLPLQFTEDDATEMLQSNYWAKFSEARELLMEAASRGYAHAAAQSAADNAALRADNTRLQNEVVVPLRERVKVLEDALKDALVRMDRARGILTDGKPRQECNWGMLATEAARAALGAKLTPKEAT